MEGLGSTDILQFAGFRFDQPRGCLERMNSANVAEPVAVGSHPPALIALLVESPGQLVAKDVSRPIGFVAS
jgi:hypothetical protein